MLNLISNRIPMLSVFILTQWVVFVACTAEIETEPSELAERPEAPYLDAAQPDSLPQVFAENFISTQLYERDTAFSPNDTELYYTLWAGAFGTILVTRKEDGVWTGPEVAAFSGEYSDLEPAFSPDGKKLFFVSNRPLEANGSTKDYDIWMIERLQNGWSEPSDIGSPINTETNEFYPSISQNGTLYFTASYDGGQGGEDIYFSRFETGRFAEPENLGPAINTERNEFNAFVAPDETYLIFSSFGREDGLGGGDLYISFRNEDGSWAEAKNMGEDINSTSLDFCPFVSTDGQFFFFSSRRSSLAPNRSYQELFERLTAPQNGNGDIYWVQAKSILY